MNDQHTYRIWEPVNEQFLYFTLDKIQKFFPMIKKGCKVYQSSGLRDVTGKLIFEGDIVKVDNQHMFYRMYNLTDIQKAVVCYFKGAFWLASEYTKKPIAGATLLEKYSVSEECCLYVVGNICEPTTKKENQEVRELIAA